ncbi:MAG: hypothetical protein M0P58_06060 [Bacteroidales bacterium]|nr:hypothetical protein [Bacteroidales bacterium]
METNIKMLTLILIFCFGSLMIPDKAIAQGVSVSFQVFYDELSPYGTWVENPDYGYVWAPDVEPGFTPYSTNGYWVFTDLGWTWISNYSWGWAPFHYGRWFTDPEYGPMWVPDDEWGPGWVTWRRSVNYYGWAPIGPGINISLAYSNGYNLPYNQWTFISGNYLGRTNIDNYYLNSSNNMVIINNSTVINNTRIDKSHHVMFNAGPDRREVERRAGRTFTPVVIQESNKPGEHLVKNHLQIYRPPVQKNIQSGPKPVPSRVESLKSMKPATQRAVINPSQKSNQPSRQQPSEKQKAQPPARQQQKQQPQAQPATQQQPQKQQPQAQPATRQQQKQQPQAQPATRQQQKQQPQAQPATQQQPQKQQPQAQPATRQPAQPQRDKPTKKSEETKQSKNDKPNKK